jgi:hypothetical protein
MGKNGEDLIWWRTISSDVKYHRRKDEHTVFGHRCPIKGDLCGIKDKGKKYGNSHPPEQPDIDAMNLLPTSQGCETGKGHQTNESVDLYAGVLWPILVEDSINDERETVEKIDKRRERQTRQDEPVTRNASGDGDGSDGRWGE